MKYLKKFEKFNLYEPINVGEYLDKKIGSVWFDQSELNYLESLNTDTIHAFSYPERNFFKIEFKNEKQEIFINKYIDDWYLVQVRKWDEKNPTGTIWNAHGKIFSLYQYKCDEFEGLKQLLSELLKSSKPIKTKSSIFSFFNRSNESLFNQRMGDKLWVEFDSTHEPFETSTGHIAGSWQFNSMKDFRNYHKTITPTQAQIDSVIELLKSSIDGINNVKYYSEYRQIYCNMWDDEKQYTYAENEKLNKINIIIDFYDEDWYFVALCDKNTRWGETETHFVCDDFDGLKQWLSDHKTIIENKK